MNDVILRLPENEAQCLYQHIHQLAQGQDAYVETYRQLQLYFFKTLTVEELTSLLEEKP
jgi:hypothetical protein